MNLALYKNSLPASRSLVAFANNFGTDEAQQNIGSGGYKTFLSLRSSSCSSSRYVRFLHSQNLTYLEIEHAFKPYICTILYTLLKQWLKKCLRSESISDSKSFISSANEGQLASCMYIVEHVWSFETWKFLCPLRIIYPDITSIVTAVFSGGVRICTVHLAVFRAFLSGVLINKLV